MRQLLGARAGVLTVAQIAQRLDERFRLLTGGSRTALPHHQTLLAAMDDAPARHDALLRHAIESRRGYVFKTVGHVFCAAFAQATDALGAAVDAQRALNDEPWSELGIRRKSAPAEMY